MTYDSWRSRAPEEGEPSPDEHRGDDYPVRLEMLDRLHLNCALTTLADNLRIGAALCRAFQLGSDRQAWLNHFREGYDPGWFAFSPGCGRAAQ